MKKINEYIEKLKADELAESTTKKYIKDIELFYKWLASESDQEVPEITKDEIIKYKEYLKSNYKPSTVNNKIIILNKYLKFINLESATVQTLKIQQYTQTDTLNQNEFDRLRRQAEQKGTDKDILILDILFFTGVRVSEIQFITAESIKKGYALINNKGKIRKVPLVKQLQKELKIYCKNNAIKSGPIILNKYNKPLSRSYIHQKIKWLAGQGRIKKSKAYAHNIRHLFAKNWLKKNNNNILQLADILGHESLETTRIYTRANIEELRATMEKIK